MTEGRQNTSPTGKHIKDLPLLPSKKNPAWKRHQRPGGDSVLQVGDNFHDKKTMDRLIAKVNQEYKGLSLAEKVAKLKGLMDGKEGEEQTVGLKGRGMGQPDYFQNFRQHVENLPKTFDDFVPVSVKNEGDKLIQAGETTGYNIDSYGVGKVGDYSKLMREGSNRVLYHQYAQHPDHGEEILRRLNAMGMNAPYEMATSATAVKWDDSWPDEPEIETEKVGDSLLGRSTQYVIAFKPRDEKEADKLIEFFERNAKHGQKDSIPHSWQVPDIRSSFNKKVDEFEKNVLNIKRMDDYELLLLKKEELGGFEAHNLWLNSDLSKFIKSLAILVKAPIKGCPIVYVPKFLAKAMPKDWVKPGHKYLKREMKGGKKYTFVIKDNKKHRTGQITREGKSLSLENAEEIEEGGLFKAQRTKIGILLKAVSKYWIKPSHKYIRREGEPGHYKYTWPDDKVEGKLPTVSFEKRQPGYFMDVDFQYDYNLKEIIKQAGGKWDPRRKKWSIDTSLMEKIVDQVESAIISEEARKHYEGWKKKTETRMAIAEKEKKELSAEELAYQADVLTVDPGKFKGLFTPWEILFLRNNGGVDLLHLSERQKATVTSLQAKLDRHLEQNPLIRKDLFNQGIQPRKRITSARIQIVDGTTAVSKNKTTLHLPKSIKRDMLLGGEGKSGKDMLGYQKKAVNWLLEVKKGILAYGVGIGKTLLALTASESLMEQGLIKKTAVAVPAHAVLQWYDEVGKFFKGKKVIVVGYDRNGSKLSPEGRRRQIETQAKAADYVIFSMEMMVGGREHELADLDFDAFIIDEAHRVKNPKAIRHKNLYEFSLGKKYKWFLTASPMPNRPEELYSLMKFINPNVLGSWQDFLAKYAVTEKIRVRIPPKKDQSADDPDDIFRPKTRQVTKVVDWKNLDDLHRATEPWMFFKAGNAPDVDLERPPKESYYATMTMEDDHASFYNDFKDGVLSEILDMGEDGFKKNPMNVLAKLQKLEQIAIAPRMVDPNYKGPNGKVDHAINMVKEHFDTGTDKAVIIFSHYRKPIEFLRGGLTSNGILPSEVAEYTGGMDVKQRRGIQEGFQQGKYKVLLATDAAQEGLNLQGSADFMIHLDTPWNSTGLEQREGRIWRTGPDKKHKLRMARLVMARTVEEKKQALVERKAKWRGQVLGVSPEEVAEDLSKHLSYDEILDLLSGQVESENG